MNIQAEVLQQRVRDLQQLVKVCTTNDHGFVEVLQKHQQRLERIERAIDGLFPLVQTHDALIRAGFLARLRWVLFGALPAVTAIDAPIADTGEDFSVQPIVPKGKAVH